jgi:hypothetical protein
VGALVGEDSRPLAAAAAADPHAAAAATLHAAITDADLAFAGDG